MDRVTVLTRLQRSGLITLAILLTPLARAEIIATQGWSRATPPGLTTAVGYLAITNTGTESRSLLRIISPICDRVMIHRSSVDNNGIARMWPLGALTLRAGETLRLEPNSYHVMFIGITAPLVAGSKVPLSLLFEDEDEVTVMLEVRPLVPDASTAEHHH